MEIICSTLRGIPLECNFVGVVKVSSFKGVL